MVACDAVEEVDALWKSLSEGGTIKSFKKEISDKTQKVIVRRAVKTDAKALIDYLNIISGESDYLTFGTGQFGRSIEQEKDFIENVLTKENANSIATKLPSDSSLLLNCGLYFVILRY